MPHQLPNIRYGVYLWTDYAPRDSTDTERVNKLQIGHHDDPTRMPDDHDDLATENPEYRVVMDHANDTITSDDCYGSLDELDTVTNGQFRKLGELLVSHDGSVIEYTDSPPRLEDTDGEVILHMKPKYENWRSHL